MTDAQALALAKRWAERVIGPPDWEVHIRVHRNRQAEVVRLGGDPRGNRWCVYHGMTELGWLVRRRDTSGAYPVTCWHSEPTLEVPHRTCDAKVHWTRRDAARRLLFRKMGLICV